MPEYKVLLYDDDEADNYYCTKTTSRNLLFYQMIKKTFEGQAGCATASVIQKFKGMNIQTGETYIDPTAMRRQ